MSEKTEFFFPSADERTQIRACEWSTDSPRAVVQLIHGIAEYIDRYDGFAKYLNQNGIAVVGNDILGHGGSVVSEEDRGFFAENNGWFTNVEDVHTLRKLTESKYKGLPYFILGHSMGSFLLRTYITKYASGLRGVVVSGTGSNPDAVLALGKTVARSAMRKGGKRVKSEAIRKMCFGSYNKRIKDPKNENEWLSRDTSVSERYCADPLCGFLPGAGVYYDMFDGIAYIQKKSTIVNVPHDLPMLFVSGSEDPVGGYGKGVTTARDRYAKAGVKDIDLKLYDGGRHEMLNEINKEEVYNDILTWLNSKIIAYEKSLVTD